jgi:hypothetical protein
MSVKQCRKCGRFQGANHSCPTLKAPAAPTVLPPNYKTTSVAISASIPTIKSGKLSLIPNSAKIDAIVTDSKKLESTIKALEFSVGNNSQNPSEAQKQMRLRLEATFGNIDWNK